MREYRGPNDLMAVFTRPDTKSELGIEDFRFVAENVAVLTALLRHAVAWREPGINVPLYGPPGTGKTELAKVCAQAAFALLFDEVEDVFPPISTDAAQLLARMDSGDAPRSGNVSGKAWVNQILENNPVPVPVIWVTHRVEQIDPAFRRRFQYHLQLKSPPPGAREALVRRALAGVEVGEGLHARLVERHDEVIEVNEMLQGMERYGGVFICTTKLFEDIDEAALRRFTFKIRFLPLRPDQREILGVAFAPDEFLSQRESEHRVKPDVRTRRSVGFVANPA